VLAHRDDLARRWLARILGKQQAGQHRLDEHQGPEAAGVGECGARGDRAAVGMPDQMDRLARRLEHGLEQGDLVGKGRFPLSRPRRAVPGTVEVRGQHPVAAGQPAPERLPLAARAGARVQAHDAGSRLSARAAVCLPAAARGHRLVPQARSQLRVQDLRVVSVHGVLRAPGPR
jgi:hypothetical protein